MEKSRNLSILTDKSLMPFGQYEGDEMGYVPCWYLLWLHDASNHTDNYYQMRKKQYPEVFDYILENLEILLFQNKKSKNNPNTTVIF